MLAHVLADGGVRSTRERADVQRALAAGAHVWVDLEARTPETDAMLAEDFKLHPLVVEDVWGERALPKIEDFDEYLYVMVHALRRSTDPCDVALGEIDVVLSGTWVVTFHASSRAVATVHEELTRSSRLLRKGPVWIAHAILDHLVDHYLPVLDRMDEVIAELEGDVIEHAGTPRGPAVLESIFRHRRAVQVIRRVGFLQREILLRLSRGEFDEIPREAQPFFRDVYDHFARAVELTEGHRELLSGALEAYLSMQSNRMNEIMKTLTLMSTVMLPITFIAGVYGMNFEHMPELRWRFGYAFALALMAAVATAIVAYFRRKRWL